MDQFEELVKRNGKIIKIVWGVPLLICILAVIGIMLCLPFLISVGRVQELERQIAADQSITPEKADFYIQEMEKDRKVKNFLSGDVEYGSILLSLYNKKGDYDKAIELSSVLLDKRNVVVYHYYRGFAYFGKKEFDMAVKEMETVANTQPESSPDLNENVLNMQKDAQSMVTIIKFKKFLSDVKNQDESEGMEEIGEKLAEFEQDNNAMKIELSDPDFNFIYLEYNLLQKQYAKVINRASQSITAKDVPPYHYFLGVAYEGRGQNSNALREMNTFLTAQGTVKEDLVDESNSIVIDKGKEYARILLADNYYNKGDYTKSVDSYKEFFYAGANFSYNVEKEKSKNTDMQEFYSTIVSKKDYLSSPINGKGADPLVLADGDRDGLSDNLENILGTGKDNEDTDGDSYEDEKELLFGHDPLRKSPDDKLTDKDYCDYFRKVLPYFASFYNQPDNQK